MTFFIRLSRLVSKRSSIKKNREDGRFLFICHRFETKRLGRIKKTSIFIISVNCPTQRQVHPVLKSTFKFWISTPNCTWDQSLLSKCDPRFGKFEVRSCWSLGGSKIGIFGSFLFLKGIFLTCSSYPYYLARWFYSFE